jgi:hypothetical protein
MCGTVQGEVRETMASGNGFGACPADTGFLRLQSFRSLIS